MWSTTVRKYPHAYHAIALSYYPVTVIPSLMKRHSLLAHVHHLSFVDDRYTHTIRVMTPLVRALVAGNRVLRSFALHDRHDDEEDDEPTAEEAAITHQTKVELSKLGQQLLQPYNSNSSSKHNNDSKQTKTSSTLPVPLVSSHPVVAYNGQSPMCCDRCDRWTYTIACDSCHVTYRMCCDRDPWRQRYVHSWRCRPSSPSHIHHAICCACVCGVVHRE